MTFATQLVTDRDKVFLNGSDYIDEFAVQVIQLPSGQTFVADFHETEYERDAASGIVNKREAKLLVPSTQKLTSDDRWLIDGTEWKTDSFGNTNGGLTEVKISVYDALGGFGGRPGTRL